MGYAVYDHLRGEETYKSGWSNAAQHVNSIALESEELTSKIKHNILNMRGLITPPISVTFSATAA